MSGKFDITAAFAQAVRDVSKSDTDRETIEYIGLDLIDDDPANFYRVDGLEELARAERKLDEMLPAVESLRREVAELSGKALAALWR